MSLGKYYKLSKTKLFYLNRSLTGFGTKKTLRLIKKEFSELKIKKVRSGEKFFDWTIPKEWNVNNAYILDKNKKKIIDFKENNLHLVGYSEPVNKIIKKNILLKRIHSLPNSLDAIPYITSYYKNYWGFCTKHKEKKKIISNYCKNDDFHVVIKSKFNKRGFLNYGELVLPGASKQEILISTYVCHPSMANNELSGPIVSMALIDYFRKIKLKKTIRFLFIPETIGSIVFIKKNYKDLKKYLVGGFNLTCIGDERMHSCMFSKYENSQSDKSLKEAYKKLKIKFKVFSFLKRGSDERQYCSPGVDLPIASIFRTKYGEYPEYHTSLDNFNVVTKKGLMGGFRVAKEAVKILLNKIIPKSKILCEPFMLRRKLYPSLSTIEKKKITSSIMNFLQYSDGNNNLMEISKIIKLDYKSTFKIYKILKDKKLLI
jgi:aminopeptidase-like protein